MQLIWHNLTNSFTICKKGRLLSHTNKKRGNVMKISTQMPEMTLVPQNENVVKNLYTEKLSKDEVKELRRIAVENAHKYTFTSLFIQSEVDNSEDIFQKNYEEFQAFLQDIGYEGKPIAELSQEEAAKLVSEDGIFGIEQTAKRIADFVIEGAGGDEELLRAGREGVLQGYDEAQELWGSELPDISQQTLQKALELIDTAMSELGYNVLDTQA